MELQTKYLGKIKIKNTDIITFSSGIPGFQEEREFVLLNLPGEDSTGLFQVLQSVKTAELAFIITNPYYFYEDYGFKLSESLLKSLEIKSKEEVTVLSIVTVKDPFPESTINLKAPIIINHEKRLGKQYILDAEKYQTKSPLSIEAAKGED